MPVSGDDSKAYYKHCKFLNQGGVLRFEIVIIEQETWNIFFVLGSYFRFVCHIQ